jgi:hypothetical protein
MIARLCRHVGFVICAVVFGGGGLCFANAITWGVILIPLVGVVVMAPFVLFHYVVWGQSESRTAPSRSRL